MNTGFAIEFWILALLSMWMTATAIIVLRARRQRVEEMQNLYQQVIGSVRTGDLPRAILILEGEAGPLATILSSILTESTKFTPKLKVSYKVTVESLKRRDLIRTNPLRIVSMLSVLVGLLGVLNPVISLMTGGQNSWIPVLYLLILALIISLVSYIFLRLADRQQRENLDFASDLGRDLLNYLLSPESPLRTLRGQAFPLPQ